MATRKQQQNRRPAPKKAAEPAPAPNDETETDEKVTDETTGADETTETEEVEEETPSTERDRVGGTTDPIQGGEDYVAPVQGREMYETDEKPQKRQKVPAKYAHPRVTPPAGKLIFPGDPLSVEATEKDNVITVDEDVYKYVLPFRSKRPTYVLLFRKGAQLPRSAWERVKADIEGPAEEESDSDD